ncbi:FkbM family methyltransferase [Halpernia sp. GG3]
MANTIMDLSSEGTPGNNIMKNTIQKLKKIHQIYKNERYLENTELLINDKTGISRGEVNRIKKTSPDSEGVTKLFENNFYYSHGNAFLHLIDEIFEDEVYKFVSETDHPFIIDCGANIGVSILYFKRLYPKAKILGFEPDEKIFNKLLTNIKLVDDLNNIELRKEAVWIEDTELSFYSEGGVAGSSVVDYSNKKNIVKVQSVDLKKYLLQTVDFLKIDIEGAENQVIFDIAPHLGTVKNLFLEYHGLTGSPQNLGDVLNVIKESGFEYYIKLAADVIKYPYFDEQKTSFNQQLNIFCYRKKLLVNN